MTRVGLALGASCLACVARLAAGPAPGFHDVAALRGLIHATHSGSAQKRHIRETLGQGLCWTDFDRDGDPDLLVLGGARALRPTPDQLDPWRLYENRGGRFEDVAPRAGLAQRAWALGCAVGDIDNDGDEDLFVTTADGPNRLFRNRGDGAFEDITARAGVGDPALGSGAAFGDLDRDGDLDLVVARYLDESRPPPPEGCLWKGTPVMCGPKGYPPLPALLYLNRGDGTFAEAGRRTGLARHAGFGLGVLLFDAEGDGDLDIFVANDSSPSHLFLNRGDATFEESGLMAGVALSDEGSAQAGMGADAGDLDGDGRLDILKTNFSDDINNFFHNDGGGVFSEWSHRSGLAGLSFTRLGWAVLLEDFDLDGDLDLFVANGHVYPQVDAHDSNTEYRQAPQLLFNDGAGRLSPRPELAGPGFSLRVLGRSAAAADFDRDGDIDLAVTRDGEPPLLLENRLAPAGASWLALRLAGTRSNREGLGARVEVVAGGRTQVREVRRSRGYLGGSDAELVFGLGGAAAAERVVIRWPSGARQTLGPLAAWRVHVVREPRGCVAPAGPFTSARGVGAGGTGRARRRRRSSGRCSGPPTAPRDSPTRARPRRSWRPSTRCERGAPWRAPRA